MTRILDDRGRLFGKVSIVDLLVLVVIVAVVVFAVMRSTNAPEESVPVKVTFLIESVDARLAEAYRTTGEVTDAGGATIGTIESVEVTPAVVDVVTPDGQLKALESSIKNDITIVVTGTGELFDSTAHIGRLTARVGSTVTLLGPGYEAIADIVDVVWGAEAAE